MRSGGEAQSEAGQGRRLMRRRNRDRRGGSERAADTERRGRGRGCPRCETVAPTGKPASNNRLGAKFGIRSQKTDSGAVRSEPQSDPNRRSGRSQIRAAIRSEPQIRVQSDPGRRFGLQSDPNRRFGRSKIRAADPGCFLSKTSPADWSHGAACRPGPGRSPPGSARRSGRAPAPEPRHSIATGRGSR